MPKVFFVKENRYLDASSGEFIADIAAKNGIALDLPCGGIGSCGKCKVKINRIETLADAVQFEDGEHSLSARERAEGYVLACQTKVLDDLEVITGLEASEEKLRILSEGKSFQYAFKPAFSKIFDGTDTTVLFNGAALGSEPGDTTGQLYGLAVDIGTTTLVVSLMDLRSGQELASESSLNPQALRAQDVLSRIKFASEPEGLEIMRREVTEKIARLISALSHKADVAPHNIYEAVYSGNTTMVHLACGINPRSLGRYPYEYLIKGGEHFSAQELGISPLGSIYVPPVISAFVGPDITSGILASRLTQKNGVTLFIDIGTNGEMIIAREGRLTATSTAAGPAFEGMNISCGMRAGEGAIEYFSISHNQEISLRTIGSAPAIGVCGSGLIDIVGELVRVGIISPRGQLARKGSGVFKALEKHLDEIEGKPCFRLTENLALTQKDIRQVQLAKGAIRSGVEALMAALGISPEGVDEVLIAGSFGYHLRPESLLNIGLFPKDYGFYDKIQFVGNTSKTGAQAFLLNRDFREELKKEVAGIAVLELSKQDGFDRLFIESLNF
ncbi:MAG: ASKHA domain-containing protein [Deltaproteobacteria bacterium]|jgi:uncharacterized 2Fe-2S/4Fe-4S cluster protein (DUF4445 family)|nr:ASKHA domain-containing protein [Deltaproteobacteria bacterium]